MSFRLFGFPIRVEPSFLLVGLFGLSASISFAIAWIVVVFITTLVHELGHAFAFRFYGRRARVSLWAFGGLTQSEGGPLEQAKVRVVSLAGPLTSMILLGIPAILVARAHVLAPRQQVIATMLVFVSVGWSLLNLLPILPLDGGHVAASILEQRFQAAGAVAARVLSIVVAAGGIAAALIYGYQFAALFGVMFILQNAREITQLRDVSSIEQMQAGHAMLDAGNNDEALRIANEVVGRAKTPPVKNAALELLAWSSLAAGRREEAGRALEQLPHDVRPSNALTAAFLVADGQQDAAREVAAEAIRTRPLPNIVLPVLLERQGVLMEVGRVLVARDASEALERVAAQLAASSRPELAAQLRLLVKESP